jgi:hypothetical protein
LSASYPALPARWGHTVLVTPQVEKVSQSYQRLLRLQVRSLQYEGLYQELTPQIRKPLSHEESTQNPRVLALVSPQVLAKIFEPKVLETLPAQGQGLWISWEVSSLEDVLPLAEELGLTLLSPATVMPWGQKLALLKGLAGEILELTQAP